MTGGSNEGIDMTTITTQLPSASEMRRNDQVKDILGSLVDAPVGQIVHALQHEPDDVVEQFAQCVTKARRALKRARNSR